MPAVFTSRGFARRRARELILGCLIAVTLFPHAPALAEHGAAELIQEGVALRRTGDDEGALRRFQQAYELDHGARALGQIGLAEQALGRWVQAHGDLTRALEATADPWIAKNGPALRRALTEVEEHVGKLEILGGSPDAEVSIDGVVRGKLPLATPLILPIGVVSVRLSGAGLVAVQRSTQIRAHQVSRESFDPLAAATASAEAVPAPVPATQAAAPEHETAAVPPSPQAPADGGGPSAARRSAKWIAWGAAAASLGVGVFGYVRQSSATGDFNDNCAVDAGGTAVPLAGKSVTAGQCNSWRSRRDSGFAMELGGLIGFGAAAATGVVLWLTEPAPGTTRSALRDCVPDLRPGVVGVGCGWRF